MKLHTLMSSLLTLSLVTIACGRKSETTDGHPQETPAPAPAPENVEKLPEPQPVVSAPAPAQIPAPATLPPSDSQTATSTETATPTPELNSDVLGPSSSFDDVTRDALLPYSSTDLVFNSDSSTKRFEYYKAYVLETNGRVLAFVPVKKLEGQYLFLDAFGLVKLVECKSIEELETPEKCETLSTRESLPSRVKNIADEYEKRVNDPALGGFRAADNALFASLIRKDGLQKIQTESVFNRLRMIMKRLYSLEYTEDPVRR